MVIIKFFLIIAIVLGLDQASKYIIRDLLSIGDSLPVIPDVFHITYIENHGAAFGILQHHTELFVILTLLIIVALLIFYFRFSSRDRLISFGIALLIGGALGNLLDRVRLGGVVDFLDFQIWPIFNLADTAVVIGAGMLIIEVLRSEYSSSSSVKRVR